jgi:DNA-binding CsgD family transcriptional regulator
MSVPARTVHTSSQLLEREHELESIEAALVRASAGAGGMLLIEGPAGVGKSRLLQRARHRAHELDMRVLEARGAVLEREFAFGAIRQLFEPPLMALPRAEREQLFAGAAGLAAALLGETRLAWEDAGGDTSFGLLHGLYWLTVNLADHGPLLISVDDAHWADSSSLRFLGYLSRRLDGIPVVLVATGRPSDPEADALWHELREQPEIAVLRPHPLSTDAVADVVRRRLDAAADEQFCQACQRATGGNPLFLNELLVALEAAGIRPTAEAAATVTEVGPPAVGRFVLHRLERLGESATALAQAVAVLGGDAELAVAADAAGLERPTARRVADLLVRADLFAPDQRLRFVHPIVQAAVYDDLLPGERAARHLAAAALLERAGAPPERVAAHLLEAGPSGEQRWVATLRRAATDAAERGDPSSAASYLARALEDAPAEGSDELLCELGRLEVAIRAFEASRGHLLQVLRSSPAVELRAQAGVWLARSAMASGEPQAASEALEAIEAELKRSTGNPALELEAEAVNLVRVELSLRRLVGTWLPRFAQRAAGHPGFEPAAQVHLASEQLLAGEPAGPLGDTIASVLPTVSPSDPFAFGAGLEALILAERYTTAARWLDLALQAAYAIGFGTRIANLHTQRAMVALRRGRVGEAQLDAQMALTVAGTKHFYAPRVAAVAIHAAVERGELQAAERVLGLDEQRLERERLFVDEFLTSRGDLKIARGEVREGLADLLRCQELHAAYGTARPAEWQAGAVRALTELGQRDRAEQLARDLLERARRFGAPRALARALRAAGHASGGREGLALLEEAVAVGRQGEARLELAYAYADLGGLLSQERRRREGREMLRRALELAVACGANALAERVRGEVGAGGGRPPRLEFTGLDALTPSERRVCDLAAAGLSNREVAQTLFVTEKTVELHLTNAYRKLGIRSRFQLSSVMPAPSGGA